jgi:hypothetical protein
LSLLDNPGSSLDVGRQTVTTAGTAVQLSTDQTRVIEVAIQAETDNTGLIVVGDSSVVASLSTRKGIALAAGDAITLNVSQLTQVFLDTTVNTDGVTFLVLRP